MRAVKPVGTMEAAEEVLAAFGGFHRAPGRDELVIRVCAHGSVWTNSRGAFPAHDFSGIVAAAGQSSRSFELGQEVFGVSSDGAAEYCIAPLLAVAPKPRCLSHQEAASVPMAALIAWQGLFEDAHLQRGERVLVHYGAGVVGGFAVQLAWLHGAQVIATAPAGSREFLRGLGAEQVIDCQESRFEECVKGVDLVFDTVGGETLKRSLPVLKPGGRLVSSASIFENSIDLRAGQRQLFHIAGLLDSGWLRPVIA